MDSIKPSKYHMLLNDNFSLSSDNGVIGNIINRIPVVSKHDAPVLLLGETGTGKEFLAEAIHRYSERKGKLIKINCAAIPEYLMESELFGHVKGAFTGAINDRQGKFRTADNGTIFLDEISAMDLKAQGKLLRAIEYNSFTPVGSDNDQVVAVRIVCACHRDNLERKIKHGEFLVDLYYRIATYVISIPPIRERKEDFPKLLNFFMETICKKSGIESIEKEVYNKLLDYQWPGNLRELKSVITTATLNACARRSSIISINDIDTFPSLLIRTGMDKSYDILESWIKLLYSKTISINDIEKQARRLILMELRTIEEGNTKKIATVLGKSESAIRTLYSKAGLKISNY